MPTGYEHDQHEFMKSMAMSLARMEVTLKRIAEAIELLANVKSEEFGRKA